jgi:hypothetical protein
VNAGGGILRLIALNVSVPEESLVIPEQAMGSGRAGRAWQSWRGVHYQDLSVLSAEKLRKGPLQFDPLTLRVRVTMETQRHGQKHRFFKNLPAYSGRHSG